jgi:hypothetical protein
MGSIIWSTWRTPSLWTVEATPARTYDEVAAARTMIERTEKRMGLKPQRLAADTAYGTGKFLGWLVGAGITPQIPVWDKSTREDGTFSRSDFTFDRERNVYVCPRPALFRGLGRGQALFRGLGRGQRGRPFFEALGAAKQ